MRPNFIDRTGQVFNNIKVIEDKGKGLVLGQCIICNDIKEYDKGELVRCNYRCKCRTATHLKTRLGEVHNNLQIIDDTGNGTVKAKCLKCGHIDTYNKNTLVRNKYRCKNCRLRDITGEVYGSFEIVEELGNKLVSAKCLKCGHIDTYRKHEIVYEIQRCKNCSSYTKIVNSIVNNIRVINHEYRGRDKKQYYSCKCLNCNEELILDYDSIFTYKCNKG